MTGPAAELRMCGCGLRFRIEYSKQFKCRACLRGYTRPPWVAEDRQDRSPVVAARPAPARPPCAGRGQPATHRYRDPEVWLCLGCAVAAGYVAEDASPVDEEGDR
jgi:hypothetical protein